MTPLDIELINLIMGLVLYACSVVVRLWECLHVTMLLSRSISCQHHSTIAFNFTFNPLYQQYAVKSSSIAVRGIHV